MRLVSWEDKPCLCYVSDEEVCSLPRTLPTAHSRAELPPSRLVAMAHGRQKCPSCVLGSSCEVALRISSASVPWSIFCCEGSSALQTLL